ncbi:hypothetical protein DM826_04720 [Halonotius aquaticus]|uniref:Uncharacterized protein n=1 Tax=Halonotius aquaticus TaxID=2216978 RepID=A0A3A6PTX3_9EURY|nr:hypothetical protein [Halonotius aquaticus]RJX43985.1 hypothetical protein DM826_04720 [Halonotius aquaticus]
MGNDVGYCRLCGAALRQGAIASEQRACCLNATTIDGVCPTHGPLGPHHVVDTPPDATGDCDTDSIARD